VEERYDGLGIEAHVAASMQPDPAAIHAQKMPTISAKSLNSREDRWDGGPGASYRG
jgi:hypothetical protein